MLLLKPEINVPFWLKKKKSSPCSLLSHFLKVLFQEICHTHYILLEQCVLRYLLSQVPWGEILGRSGKAEALWLLFSFVPVDLWGSVLCYVALKDLFSFHLSRVSWKFFFLSNSPPPSSLFQKVLALGKWSLIIYHTILWQTTRIQGKAREKGHKKTESPG